MSKKKHYIKDTDRDDDDTEFWWLCGCDEVVDLEDSTYAWRGPFLSLEARDTDIATHTKERYVKDE